MNHRESDSVETAAKHQVAQHLDFPGFTNQTTAQSSLCLTSSYLIRECGRRLPGQPNSKWLQQRAQDWWEGSRAETRLGEKQWAGAKGPSVLGCKALRFRELLHKYKNISGEWQKL